MSEETKNERYSEVFAGAAVQQPVVDEHKVADIAVRMSLQAQMAALRR